MSPHPVAVFVSGTGRHLENFARLAESGELPIDVVLVLANREGIGALERAQRLGLTSLVLDPERELDSEEFSRRAFTACEDAGAQTVLLAGFLRRLAIPPAWRGRVLNIHPSLLPAFGGQGYWGERVHRAVLERGCRISGCTVHYVDDEYDHGPILVQRAVTVEPGEDPDSLAERVFAAELEAYPAALLEHLGK